MIQTPLPDERYLPWRELRRRQPTPRLDGPDFMHSEDGSAPSFQLTHEEWWYTVRKARQQQSRTIPTLLSTDGRPFSFVLTDAVLRDSDYVTGTLKGDIGIGEDVIGSASRERYIVHSLEEEAITSSQIEGAVTTRRVAKEMLHTGRRPRDISEQMILNNYNVMRYIREVRHQPLTPELVCDIHRMVTDGTLENPLDAGRLQNTDENRVGVYVDGDETLLHQPPSADQLASRLEALCAFANGLNNGPYLPGALRAIVVHFMMGYNHFFVDGNGRTARSLFYWTMLHNGYWLSEFISISKHIRKAHTQYGMAFLDVETDANDLTYFFLYHLKILRRAIEDLESYITTTTAEMNAARKRLDPSTREFNMRQIAVLDAAFRHRGQSWTTKSVSHQFGVTVATAQSDLDSLAKQGWLERRREGRRYAWYPTNRLDELTQE